MTTAAPNATASISPSNTTSPLITIPTPPGYLSYLSSCSLDYWSWNTASISSSYSSYLESRKTSSWDDTPQTITEFPWYSKNLGPPCCTSVWSRYSGQSNAWDGWSSRAYSSALDAGVVSYSYSTSTWSHWAWDDEWYQCNFARTITGEPWTWVDGGKHISTSLLDECPGTSTSTYTSEDTFTQTLWPSMYASFATPSACYTTQCSNCHIRDGGHIQVLYWPVSLGSSGSSTWTISPTTTGIVTAKYGDTVLTSPTVYISFSTLYAGYGFEVAEGSMPIVDGVYSNIFNPCTSSHVGKTYSDVIIPIPTNQGLSTIHFIANTISESTIVTRVVAPFNYANLPPNPVPMSVWLRQCGTNVWGSSSPNQVEDCAVIVDEAYGPRLQQPLAVRDFDPAWENCTFNEDDWFTSWDPPVPLQGQPELTVPTITAADLYQPHTTPATPASYRHSVYEPTKASTDLQMPEPTGPGGYGGGSYGGGYGSGLESVDPGSKDNAGSGGSHGGGGKGQDTGSSGTKSGANPGSSNNGDPQGSKGGGTGGHVPVGAGFLDPARPPLQPAATFTIDRVVYTAHPSSPIIFPSATLLPGGRAMVNGHIVSVSNNGIAVNGTFISFTIPAAPAPTNPPYNTPTVTTINGIPFTKKPDGSNEWIGGGTTIEEGDSITINGEVIKMNELIGSETSTSSSNTNGAGKLEYALGRIWWIGMGIIALAIWI